MAEAADISTFHHHDKHVLADPWPLYARMRKECPVAHSDRYGGFWILSRYADILDAARQPALFSSAHGVVIPAVPSPMPLIPFEVDPPLHRQYRLLELRHLGPRPVAALEPVVREVARGLISSILERGEADLVTDFALPFTSTVFCRLMGVPESDRPSLLHWTAKILERAERPEQARQAVSEFFAFLDLFLTARRDAPGDDLTTVLLTAELDGRPLTMEDLRSMCFTLLLAGLETTILAIGTNFRYLAEHPDLRQRLIDEPELIPGVVEELLRLDGPVQGHVRTLTSDVAVHGQKLQAGERVLLLWAAGNRDAAEFEDPDALRPERYPNHHLTFGIGPHRCVGAHLAQLELVVSLEEALALMPGYRLAAPPELYPTARGPRRLPIRV